MQPGPGSSVDGKRPSSREALYAPGVPAREMVEGSGRAEAAHDCL